MYSKEFLVEAFVSRYEHNKEVLRDMANKYYNAVDRKTFREYTSLDAAAITRYKNSIDK